MIGSKTIGLELSSILGQEKLILQNLKNCKQILNADYFKVYLFHNNISQDKIKIFLKQYSDVLLELNIQITKNYNSRVFYFIQEKMLNEGNWRYCYTGNIIQGLKEYKNLVTHIINREVKRFNTNNG